jgi:hypothetical protein
MTDNNVFTLAQPGTFADSLTEILRGGAQALLKQAVEAEVADFLHRHADLKTEAGRRRVVRHGYGSQPTSVVSFICRKFSTLSQNRDGVHPHYFPD